MMKRKVFGRERSSSELLSPYLYGGTEGKVRILGVPEDIIIILLLSLNIT
jgi:hypothetical protein